MYKYLLAPLFLLASACSTPIKKHEENLPTTVSVSKHAELHKRLDEIIKPYHAKVGLSILHIENHDSLTVNGNQKFPMQSTYKFPLAMVVLKSVDEGKINLDQKIRLTKKELLPETHSPLRDKYPKGGDASIREILEFTVSQSDNNGCDILFTLMNGPIEVEKIIHGWGVTDMAIKNTEDAMHQNLQLPYENYCKPFAMASLFNLLYNKKQLSDSSTKLLMGWMKNSVNDKRLKGLLPEDTEVFHKTGTGGQDEKGMVSATNDVGIITLPNGEHLVVCVFVSDAMETRETCEKIIAEISKVAFDYFNK